MKAKPFILPEETEKVLKTASGGGALRQRAPSLTVVGLLHKRDSLLFKKFTGCMDVRNRDANVSCQM